MPAIICLLLLVLILLMSRAIVELKRIPKRISELIIAHIAKRVHDIEQEVAKIKSAIEK